MIKMILFIFQRMIIFINKVGQIFFKKVFEYIGADYYTLYDHPDKYWLPMYDDLTSKIIATPSTHWRTTPSTTNTYACTYETLMKHFDTHVKYCDLIEKWTKDHDKFTDLWNQGSNLISCIPGYSAHVEANMLSPIINWEAEL